MTTRRTHRSDTAGLASRMRRLPLVLVMMLALAMSLLQSFDCCAAIAGNGAAMAAITADGDTPPSGPDGALPVHACHCLCHITAQTADMIVLAADVPLRAPAYAGQPIPVSPARPPLDEPPRA